MTMVRIANGCISDLNDVKLGITNASEFAYLADGVNGLRVVQLTSPETPGSAGRFGGFVVIRFAAPWQARAGLSSD